MSFTPEQIGELADRYDARKAELQPRLAAFAAGRQPFLIVQSAPLDVYGRCNQIEDVVAENLRFFERQLSLKSDWLPYLEPWMGTGVYANAFGCEYVWREGESPAVHYRYRRLAELEGIGLPRVEDSPVMLRVLDTIARFREVCRDRLPIALTDTQSPNDSATLILDACEVFACALLEPEPLRHLHQMITDLIIEFSRRQRAAIGKDLLACPGHIMVSDTSWTGLSISDDNLAVVSPAVGRAFCLAYDQQLADAFGGVAIHSCGRWQHLMPDVATMRGVTQVDLALDRDNDPNPNDPEPVRDAFAGSGIAVKVRGPHELDRWLELLPRLLHPELRLILQLQTPADRSRAAANYDRMERALSEFYA